MFERYIERARRFVFLARYEGSKSGSTAIASGNLLLGLLREANDETFSLSAFIENETGRILRIHKTAAK